MATAIPLYNMEYYDPLNLFGPNDDQFQQAHGSTSAGTDVPTGDFDPSLFDTIPKLDWTPVNSHTLKQEDVDMPDIFGSRDDSPHNSALNIDTALTSLADGSDLEKPLAKSTRRRKNTKSKTTIATPTATKRNRRSSQSKESFEPSPPAGRRNSRVSVDSGSPLDDPSDPKRQHKLERNRVAASKCRQRNKRQEEKLAEKGRMLDAERADLLTEAGALQHEVLALKNEILKHGFCNCELIQKYIADSARQVAHGSPQVEQGAFQATPAF